MTEQASRRRIALVLEYDGGQYGGSQLQPRVPSVQGELEQAIHQLTGEPVRLALAGRTDAGVHAQGQVAAFTTTSVHDTDVIARGLNAWLPDDIAVRRAWVAPIDFDPRRHALSRTYRYTISNTPARSPLWRHRAWHVAEPLDTEAMQRAAATLAGERDFASFTRKQNTSTVRCVHRCEVARRGCRVLIDIEANAFLRQQVRRTAGALVSAGRGRLTFAAFRDLLRHPKPAAAGPLAPPQGLCLMRVSYPPKVEAAP